MADDKTTEDGKGEGKKAAAPKGADLRQPTRLPVEEHIANAREYHGEPSHVIAGAVEALIENGAAERGDHLTSEQVKRGINMFRDHKIDNEGAQG